jgi:hypothetical protein
MSNKAGWFRRNFKAYKGLIATLAIEFLGGYYGSRAAIWRMKWRFWTKTDRLSRFNPPSHGVWLIQNVEKSAEWACNSSSWVLRGGMPPNIADPQQHVNRSMSRGCETSWA